MTVFVPFAAPGERVRVRVLRRQKRFLEAELLEVLEPAPERVTPRCPHFTHCGGCDLQHLDYSAQLALKQAMVEGALRKARLEVPVAPIVPSHPYGYRQRVTLHCAEGRPGYFARRSHTLIPLQSCPVLTPELEQRCRELPASLPDGVLTLGGEVAGAFSQGNAEVNSALVALVEEVAQKRGARSAYDLYAGAGNFALPLAQRGLAVTAVEREGALVQAGRAKAQSLGLELPFVQAEVEAFLKGKPAPVELVVADPPRTGLGDLVTALPTADTLVLISCDLACGTRDLARLVEHGWRLEQVVPLDMFAQTAQIELLSVLSSR